MKMQFDDDALEPLIEKVVTRVLDQREGDEAKGSNPVLHGEFSAFSRGA